MMRKGIKVLVVVSLMALLTGCSKSLNYVIGYVPDFYGIVESIEEDYIVINVSEDESIYSEYQQVQVSLDVIYKDGKRSYECGDGVYVCYDGNITEGKVETVYAILLVDPVNRESNNAI